MKETINIIWCKKNLRVNDNEILANINPEKKTLAVYFFEPQIMSLPDFGDFHLKFIIDSLLELQHSYIKLGIPILLLPYDAIEGFQKLQHFFDIQKIYSHEETGNWKSYMRDKHVIAFCKSENILLQEFPTNGVVRRLKDRDDWSSIWKKRISQKVFTSQVLTEILVVPKELGEISKNTKRLLQEKVSSLQHIQKGGEAEGIKILQNFLSGRSKNYMYHIGKPLAAEKSCSRISPYITYGCLSIKYIYIESYNRIQELKAIGTEASKNHAKSINFFLARIHWQSHFIQKLEDEPELEFQNLDRDFDKIRQEADDKLIEKVFQSKSGIPYIDAVMRQLHQTGWTNFRSRAIIVSFLCNTCMQPWQKVAPKLARLFTDYEPGIHYPQFQMQAGTTGINTIRIYNPVYNGKQKDPEGSFMYQYLPELKSVPTQYIHEPHLWEEFEKLDYPEPLIDIKSANKKAKDLLWTTKGNLLKSEKEKIIKKHASRAFHGKKKPKKIIQKQVSELQSSLF